MLPLTTDELYEVTAQVGFALWQTQVAEETVGAYLVFVHQATPAKLVLKSRRCSLRLAGAHWDSYFERLSQPEMRHSIS
jgi:hypothetical protein